MNRRSWKCLLVGVVVAVGLFCVVQQANAQWWGYYRPVAAGCCYTPAYVSPCYSGYSPCYYGSDWYLGVRPGPVRRLVFGPYRWYRTGCGWGCGYSYGCYSSCCGYDTVYSPCCTDDAKAPAAGGQVPTPAKKPVEPPAANPVEPGPVPAAPMPNAPKTTATSADNSGILTVWVPYDAKVTVNGLETKSTGSRRQYVSYGLQPGLTYKYVVKAQVVRNGQVVEDTRTVTLTAGQISGVAFGFNTTAEQVAAAQ